MALEISLGVSLVVAVILVVVVVYLWVANGKLEDKLETWELDFSEAKRSIRRYSDGRYVQIEHKLLYLVKLFLSLKRNDISDFAVGQVEREISNHYDENIAYSLYSYDKQGQEDERLSFYFVGLLTRLRYYLGKEKEIAAVESMSIVKMLEAFIASLTMLENKYPELEDCNIQKIVVVDKQGKDLFARISKQIKIFADNFFQENVEFNPQILRFFGLEVEEVKDNLAKLSEFH